MPLAEKNFLHSKKDCPALSELAEQFVDPEKGVEDGKSALAGAGDIIAEMISDDAAIRGGLRTVCCAHGSIRSDGASENLGCVRNVRRIFRTY